MVRPMKVDPIATAQTKARYDRNSPLYDLIEGPMELLALGIVKLIVARKH
jgi:hypothetical protein